MGDLRYIPRLLVLLLIFSNLGGLYAQSVEVPIPEQVPLLLKSLSFDRNFDQKLENNKTIVIGIVYQQKTRRSVNQKNDLVEAILKTENQQLIRYGLTYRLIPVDEGLSEDVRIQIQSCSIMYTTSLKGIEVDGLGEISRSNNVLSVAVAADDCRNSLSMSFVEVKSRAKLLIHLRAARAEGCNFSSQLLKIAKTF